MNIISWLKRIINLIFKHNSTKQGDINSKQFFSTQESRNVIVASSPSEEIVKKTSSAGLTVDKTDDSYKELQELKKKAETAFDELEKTKNLVHLGFIIVLIMVAGIIISLLIWLISNSITNAGKLYDLEVKDYGTLNECQNQFNNLDGQIKDFKNCLNSGKYFQCFK